MKHLPFFPCITTDKEGHVLSLETWHPVDGEWIHIMADYKNKKFYTNGKEEK